MFFPVSGVQTNLWEPPLIAMIISFFTSMGGMSGAVLLLPYQISVLNFVNPSVTPTNLLYNIIATPGGIYVYLKEAKIIWPFVYIIIAGNIPGMITGGFIRILLLPDARAFKLFVGIFLLIMGFLLLKNIKKDTDFFPAESSGNIPCKCMIQNISFDFRKIKFEFNDTGYAVSTSLLSFLSFIIGIFGGIYGISGGALIVTFLILKYSLPVYLIAGVTLFVNFLVSSTGCLFFQIFSSITEGSYGNVAPDYALGALFGIGGLIGGYLGALCQKFMPAKIIMVIITAIIFVIAILYISDYATHIKI